MYDDRKLDFSDALFHLKKGYRVSRYQWNDKGLFVMYQKGYPDGIPINANTAEATGYAVGTVCRVLPYLCISTFSGLVPWVPTQVDILAEDWFVFRRDFHAEQVQG